MNSKTQDKLILAAVIASVVVPLAMAIGMLVTAVHFMVKLW